MEIKNKFLSLDALRALSALVVAYGHSRALMILPSAKIADLSILNKALYFLAGFGPQAVMIFFVLSGFFITRSIFKSKSGYTFTLSEYFLARWVRLTVVVVPALLITLLFDSIGLRLFLENSIYGGGIVELESIDISGQLNLKNFVGNLFFLQKMYCDTFGSNGPLWSISYEWWFYVLAPLFFGSIGILKITDRKINRTLSILLLLLVSSFIAIGNPSILLYFFYWLFGSLAYYLPLKIKRIKGKFIHLSIAILLVLVTASLSRLRLIDLKVADFLISISVFYLVYVLQYVNFNFQKRAIEFFAKISFTLYAVHFPFVALLSTILGWIELQPNLEGTLKNLFLFILSIGFSYLVWLIFEKNTNRFKTFLKQISN
jgi:peptidoglycan/LPS O-acetylase OafA/YrhL